MEKNKKTKIVLIIIALALVVASGGGYMQYRHLVNATQGAYHVELPTEKMLSDYTTEEKAEYNSLLEQREYAFSKLDVQTLQTTDAEIVALYNSVQERLITKLVEQTIKDVQALKIDNAKDDEAKKFNTEKEALETYLKKADFVEPQEPVVEVTTVNQDVTTANGETTTSNEVTEKYATTYSAIKKELTKKVDDLKKTQQTTQKTINDRLAKEKAEQEAEEQASNSYNDYTGGYTGGGSTSGGYTGGGSNGGGSAPKPPVCHIEIHEQYYEYTTPSGGVGWGTYEYPVEVCD